jgi:hypothetical protein
MSQHEALRGHNWLPDDHVCRENEWFFDKFKELLLRVVTLLDIHIDPCWAYWAHFGPPLGSFGAIQGPIGLPWAPLGVPRGDYGVPRGSFMPFLRPSWRTLTSLWAHLGAPGIHVATYCAFWHPMAPCWLPHFESMLVWFLDNLNAKSYKMH